MGFVKRVFSAPKPKPQPVVQPQPVDTESSSDTAAKQEKKKNAALLARNAGARSAVLGSEAGNVTTKTLLGL